MNQIPIRALRNHTAEVLGRVKAGEIVELTEHGRPVARIVPLTLDRWEHLRLLGELEAPEVADGTDVVEIAPVDGAPGVAPASEILEGLRNGER